MQQVLIGIILILGFTTYFLYKENSTLNANNQLLEGAVVTQKEAIENLQNDFVLQTNSLLQLQSKNQEIEQEMSRYLDIFKRHNLTKLAAAKPGLVEPRVNKGTKDVFNSIEEASRNIDNLDDGLQLQPDSK
tara:strand:+ start:116 stop:511 length:396 start_codon:yes stop_codon:yes gene_type:complete